MIARLTPSKYTPELTNRLRVGEKHTLCLDSSAGYKTPTFAAVLRLEYPKYTLGLSAWCLTFGYKAWFARSPPVF